MDNYVFNYNDGTSMMLELTEDQWRVVSESYFDRTPRILLEGIGVLDIQDVRSIIKQKPVLNENPSYSTEMTQEEKDYIAQQQQFEQYLKEKRDSDLDDLDDSDFDGSDF
jgi:hypothetical protein